MGLRRLRALSLNREKDDSLPESFGAPAFLCPGFSPPSTDGTNIREETSGMPHAPLHANR
ncbi:hypothetical protein CXT95_00240 [Akkermansia muciniphila]|uniref:Uncharacterized protein n=1 Tax=Akkermansia muciniphila TaxID=239935 RepID=A0AAX0WNH0_9BACT|nr:hypothetical protein CXT95_00240 [Akkermansia muciniphila]